jgi:hypothetical protein
VDEVSTVFERVDEVARPREVAYDVFDVGGFAVFRGALVLGSGPSTTLRMTLLIARVSALV